MPELLTRTDATASPEPLARVRAAAGWRPFDAVGVVAACIALAFAVLGSSDLLLASSSGLLRYLDDRRPHRTTVSASVAAQAQLFHLHVVNLSTDASRVVPVVGSSSVINGVDVGRVNAGLGASTVTAANFGITGLAAYELPLLQEYLLPKGRRDLVFVYNAWMFPRSVYAAGLRRRWNTREALKLFDANDWHTADLPRYASAIAAEVSFAFRFNEFLKTQLVRWATGRLTYPPNFYDYLDDTAEDPPTPERPIPLKNLDARLRRWYVESHAGDETVGWRGFARLLDLARERGVRVLVVPMPTRQSEEWAYQQGLDLRGVDAHVRRVAQARGAVVVDRDRLPRISDDTFRDESHLRVAGRALFSEWLGEVVAAHRRTARQP